MTKQLIKATGQALMAMLYITKHVAPKILIKRNLLIDFIKNDIATTTDAK